ncbi:Fip1 motif-containing protein [Spironucleus salmonicida]|uniref:Fip1 motif-containing protein n=1 Tax=Spironucleus salmonicida TaxID=348837 RepID=V6LVC9_9EUKA|nr:Fip1 motif-containing protein [Spironucleus salmonicida]|eukprot:EST48602.1 Fip1 motif-containing protein [Spironucleus salmonicida]
MSDSESLNIADQQLLEKEEFKSNDPNMMQFLIENGPINHNIVQKFDSELDLLRSLNGFREFVNPNDLHFNYYFDEDSWALYSKMQGAMRLELTEFRSYFEKSSSHLKEKSLMGYYYEMGCIQTQDARPQDYDNKGRRLQGRRQ